MDVDFGTYHHSTPNESNDIRERAEKAFSKLLRSLYPSGAALRILDAGCGLGFLTYVAAKRFPKARITGVDLFRHGSISEISIDNAANNMRSLGIGSRTYFLKHDLTKPMESDARYDLAVSNLVFHNMGRKRFKAYGAVFDALKPRGFFVIGDLFPHDKADMDYFRKRSTLINQLEEGPSGPWAYKIKVLNVHPTSSACGIGWRTPLSASALSGEVTLGELQGVYEAILSKQLDKRKFHRKIELLGTLRVPLFVPSRSVAANRR